MMLACFSLTCSTNHPSIRRINQPPFSSLLSPLSSSFLFFNLYSLLPIPKQFQRTNLSIRDILNIVVVLVVIIIPHRSSRKSRPNVAPNCCRHNTVPHLHPTLLRHREHIYSIDDRRQSVCVCVCRRQNVYQHVVVMNSSCFSVISYAALLSERERELRVRIREGEREREETTVRREKKSKSETNGTKTIPICIALLGVDSGSSTWMLQDIS